MDRSNLLAHDLTPLIGRKADLADLAALVTDPDVRLVTVTGAGGIGKTRLARTVIRDVEDDFSDGVTFVDLVSVTQPDLTPVAIASALSIPLTEATSPDEALIAELESQNRLLILDNMEHLLPAVPFVEQLLLACPDIAILTTSRQRLEVPGERVFELRPLSSPDQHAPGSLDAIMQSESVQLFVAHARAVDRDFTLTEENAGEVAALCRRLDGLPLAIELAAARIADIPLRTMLRSFASILPFLEGPAHTRDIRHRTMSNAIAWSYGALPPDERKLLGTLAVFSGGCALPAIESLALPTTEDAPPPDEHTRKELVNNLGELMQRHLLVPVDWNHDNPRYDMLQTVREYCLAQLVQSGEEPALREAHARTFLEFAEPLRKGLQGPEPDVSLRQFALEMDNFRAALTWSTSASCDDPLLALRLCNRLAHYWLLRRAVAEARRWYALTLAKAGDGETIDHATAYLQLGHLSYRDLMEAHEHFERSLQLFRKLGNKTGIVRLLIGLGFSAIQLGRYDEAASFLDEGGRLSRKLGDTYAHAHSAHYLGLLAVRTENYRRAKAYFQEARDEWEQLGDALSAGVVIGDIAMVYRLESRFTEAEQILTWWLARFEEAEIELAAGPIRSQLGLIAQARGDFSTAVSEYRTAIQKLVELNIIDNSLAMAIECMATAASRMHRDETAVALLASTDHWIEESHYKRTPEMQLLISDCKEKIRSRVGIDEFQTWWNSGASLDLLKSAKMALGVDLGSSQDLAAKTITVDATSFGLTNQERRILCAIALGDTNRKIAESLFISERTVAVHVQSILRKLNADNRTHASALAFHANLCA